ncbi:MAG: hypothetical protein ACKO96_12090 [Flammeovirgaceae bacterium]
MKTFDGRGIDLKKSVNWKGGLRAAAVCVVIYVGYIYLMFFAEPSGGWSGVSHNLRYPIAVIAPLMMAFAVYHIFRGTRHCCVSRV